jgi:type III restriction enzyme
MVKLTDKQTFRNEDLVLKVSGHIAADAWDDTEYEQFLDALCSDRDYQKEAIRQSLRFLLGGRYQNLCALAKENFDNNEELQRRHGSFASMEAQLQFPGQLACSIDLATGTGKSYVLYGLAAIMLAHGAIDRVLVLCPSNTIEAGLLGKFRALAMDADLRDALPSHAKVRVPKIIDATQTIVEGAVCVENYHAILKHVRSSISDSLKGRGARCLVLSDEAHHVANEPKAKVSQWKTFLLDPDFGFRYHVGVSGTCYVGDDYFTDVVSRYSLRQAMEQNFVKRVEYVTDTPTMGDDEKWQLVHSKHEDIAKKLKKKGIKPLTIVVTRDISACTVAAEELQTFLVERMRLSKKAAEEQVLPVTSAAEHQPNLARLVTVDNPKSPVRWIVSVSMLSEGWDVKNVFQIYPHEERAFNSKLLIAQVLGRGLRRPDGWSGEPPMVSVFNHDAWSGRIRHLVDEVLEIEKRVSSEVFKSSRYHFELHTLDYERVPQVTESAKKGEYRLLEKGYVDLPTQVEDMDVVVEFERVFTSEKTRYQATVSFKTYSVDEVADHMYQRLRAHDEESRSLPDPEDHTNYAKKFPHERCVELVTESLRRANIESGRITEETRQKILQALGTLNRRTAKRVVYTLKPKVLKMLSTSYRQAESCGAAELRKKERVLFWTEDTSARLADPVRDFFSEVIDEDGEYSGASFKIEPPDFKTPVNLVIAEANPERKFVRALCDRKNARELDAWIKNTPQRFYAIEYAWKKGTYPKRGEFSPDFFIKVRDLICIVEVKDDTEARDPSLENRKKFEYASQHVRVLNEWLEREELAVRYQLNFLTPSDFSKFFQCLRDKELAGFKSELDIVLAEDGKALAR